MQMARNKGGGESLPSLKSIDQRERERERDNFSVMCLTFWIYNRDASMTAELPARSLPWAIS